MADTTIGTVTLKLSADNKLCGEPSIAASICEADRLIGRLQGIRSMERLAEKHSLPVADELEEEAEADSATLAELGAVMARSSNQITGGISAAMFWRTSQDSKGRSEYRKTCVAWATSRLGR